MSKNILENNAINNNIIYNNINNENNNEINSDNNAIKLPDAVLENLKKAQSEKLGKVISNMKLKIMSKYFHRFRYNTLGI